MQGSPLLRTLLTAAVLAVAALVLLRLTSAPAKSPDPQLPAKQDTHTSAQAPAPSAVVPFELVLSAPATELQLLDANERVLFQTKPDSTTVSGSLPHRPDSLLIHVRWKGEATGHRFARLSLEPSGESTLRQIFEGAGDLDEFWELPAAP